MAKIKVIPYEEATGKLKDIYEELLEKRGKLAAVHTIQSLNPESILAHMDLYMAVMFSQSSLSRSQREMIAVVVSVANGCLYCQQHHGVALNNYWKNSERIERLNRNYQDAELSAVDTIVCSYAIELTRHPGDFQKEDKVIALRQAGLDDRAILDATLVVSYFNFVNRMVLALGVELEEMAGEGYKY